MILSYNRVRSGNCEKSIVPIENVIASLEREQEGKQRMLRINNFYFAAAINTLRATKPV